MVICTVFREHAAFARSRRGGCYADHAVVAESGVNGQVHTQLGDPAVERMPVAVRIGAPQKRVERIDCLLPQVQPVPVGTNHEGEF